ncbi:MAG: DUF805 domain-containing protein [Schwartzia sp.]|nr:DUF805 domain-containing protein [Schwartzia sp. (in: firmicutes)]
MEKRNGLLGKFYSCSFCGATVYPPNSPLLLDERLQKAVESYCRICVEYRRLIDSSIFSGMNPKQCLSLLRDCEKKFSKDTEDYLLSMDKILQKPAFIDARKVINAETALVFARFAEACAQLNQFQEGKRYIDHALELADPSDENYKTIFATQSEINAHLNTIETSVPSNTPLLTNSNASLNTKEQKYPFVDESNESTPFHKIQTEDEKLIAKHEKATSTPLCSLTGLFSMLGRRRRLPYLGMIIANNLITVGLCIVFQNVVFFAFLLIFLSFWIAIANVFKRVHDINKPNSIAILYSVILILNTIFLFIRKPLLFNMYFFLIFFPFFTYVCCKPGTNGSNQYGASPEMLKEQANKEL